MPLKAAEVREMPTLACLGRFAGIAGEPKINEKGTVTIPINIEPLEQGKAKKFFLRYREEMLTDDYTPATPGDAFLYRSIALPEDWEEGDTNSYSDVPALRALAGDRYTEVTDKLIAVNGRGPQGVAEVLAEELSAAAEAGHVFGYVLKQSKEDTGEVDENGKKIKRLTRFYDVDRFYIPTEEVNARLAKRADKGGIVLTYEV